LPRVSLPLKSLLILFFSVMAAAAAPSHDIEVKQAWARATPPGAPVGAAYAVIENKGHSTERLLAVESDACRVVEIHTTTHVDGKMQMRPVEYVDIPAGGRVALEPGGLHLMLVDLKLPLQAGEHLPLTFVLQNAGRVSSHAVIAPIGATHAPEHSAHEGHH
jgi:copper(I)-binding protein